jgi:hypothetical protein
MPEAQLPLSEKALPPQPARQQTRIGTFRYSAAQFLISLALLFAATPFLEFLKNGDAIDSALLTVVLVSGVFAVGRRRWKVAVTLALLVPASGGKWVNHFRPDLLSPQLHFFASMLFVAFILSQFLHFIFRAPKVNSEVLCAGVAGYLLLGILWMFAYEAVSRMIPGSFAFNTAPAAPHVLQRFDAFYFSYTTLSTVGYGDITPVSHVARSLAMMEAMTGTLYVAVLIARLVALYTMQVPDVKERNG